MADESEILQSLTEMGLTRSEAEVYLATLSCGRDEAVSGYKVAQSMGRDPANLAKILAALVRRGAVQVVQDKPRLYVAVPPAEFTTALLDRMQATGSRAVQLLRAYSGQRDEAMVLALADSGQALARAATLLSAAGSDVLVGGSPDLLVQLAESLREVAMNPSLRTSAICTEDVDLGPVAVIKLNAEAIFTGGTGFPPRWLLLVVDQKAWLSYQSTGDDGDGAGWWSRDPGLAGVAGAMIQVVSAAAEWMTEQLAEQSTEPSVTATDASPEASSPGADPVDTEGPDDTDDTETPAQDGIQFIIRHDQK